ncbi:ATP-binding protein [Kitasatospora camelliae]|uniref:AAA family ATPase n=1 Tax=Kitasatospora camelliae TaxID=3156397 RepID=A0AAU8K479_9ACTN
MISVTGAHAQPSLRPGDLRFVGRRRELDLLLGPLRRPPAVVLVEGEAGIGKSRLLREAAAVLRGENRLVLTGSCHPLREPLPYGPLVDALQRAVPDLPATPLPSATGALARLLPALAPHLPPAPPVSPDPRTARRELVQAVGSLLATLAPAVLVVDDAHWIDPDSRDLLLLLARDLPDRLGLVVGYRAEDLPPDTPVLGAAYRHPPGTGGSLLRLGPLGRAEVRDLATAALGRPATPALTSALFRRSEGLPLVVEEDLATLREHGGPLGAPEAAARLRAAGVPRGLDEAVLERWSRLSPDGRAVVEAAAVLAAPAVESVVCAVAGLDPDRGAEGLVEALRTAVLHESGGHQYAFRRGLARQAVYRRIPGPRRARLHARAVAELERRGPAPLVQIARHTLALGDRQGWLARAREAADHAFAAGDCAAAASLLRQVLRRPEADAGLRAHAASLLARVVVGGTDGDADTALLRQTLTDPALPVAVRGEIRLALGLLQASTTAGTAGLREIAAAADDLAGSPERAARALIALALDESDGPAANRAWLERAELAVRGTPEGVEAAAVRATRLTLLAWRADPAVWAQLECLPRSGPDLAVLQQTARALHNVGDAAADLGHDGRAAALAAEAVRVAQLSHYPVVELHAQVGLLRSDVLAGRWEGLAERFEALAEAHPAAAVIRAESLLFLGVRAAAQGQRARAVEYFERAADEGRRRHTLSVATRAAAGLVSVALARGAADEAWAIAQPALARLRRAEAWPKAAGLVAAAVESALQAGERAVAERLVEEVGRGLAGRDAPAAAADLALAHGLLLEAEEPAAAAERSEAARRGWQEIGRPQPSARAAEFQARAAARTCPEQAADPLAAAIDGYAALGATADLARCRRTQRQLGLVRPAATGRRGYGRQLSPREREVAALLARHATNQEIADALFLSTRTVEQHVAKVLKKLGAKRGSIATALERLAEQPK